MIALTFDVANSTLFGVACLLAIVVLALMLLGRFRR